LGWLLGFVWSDSPTRDGIEVDPHRWHVDISEARKDGRIIERHETLWLRILIPWIEAKPFQLLDREI
jgi:hypothetical protein